MVYRADGSHPSVPQNKGSVIFESGRINKLFVHAASDLALHARETYENCLKQGSRGSIPFGRHLQKLAGQEGSVAVV